MPDPLKKFTEHLRSVLLHAATNAAATDAREVSFAHVLDAMRAEKGCIAADVMVKARVSSLESRVLNEIPTTKRKSAELPVSDDVRRSIEKAIVIAAGHSHRYVGTEHLLSGMLQIDDAAVREGLHAQKSGIAAVRQRLTLALKSAGKFPELTEQFQKTDAATIATVAGKKKTSKTPALDFFAIDLTNPPAGRTLDPVIGREREIDRVIRILCRRTKNNPLLLGDPGVGKTAIVEGLARRVMEGTVPDALAGKRICALDLALVIAGTIYRGEFEGRLKSLVEEVKNNPDIILFVDEVHTLSGAGSASGSLDAASILKPALARGEIRMIGATTPAEFKKHIEPDAALERRFQTVAVNEPSALDTIEILKGLREHYERFHRVVITDAAIERAVSLAGRYLTDKFFPDKAIDLIDEAASAARLAARPDENAAERRRISAELREIGKAKERAVEREAFDVAQKEKTKETELRAKLAQIEKADAASGAPVVSVGPAEVAAVIASMHQVNPSELNTDEQTKLRALETVLRERVVGQDDTVATVANAIRRARMGVTDPRRPLASFLLLGPTGVGKSLLARTLAAALYDDPAAFVKLDMSEFSEPFTVSKLIGAPAGYVGYRDVAKLTDAVKRRPHAVILFDEIEKAHPDVARLLLQILEDGELTDAVGRTVSFRNAVIILTSNLGSEIFRGGSIGFGDTAASTTDAVRAAASAHLSPELMHRLDAVCVMKPLTIEQFTEIAGIHLTELADRLKLKGVTFAPTTEACARLAQMSYNTEAGARAVRQVIQEQVENRIAERMLEGKSGAGSKITLSVQNDLISIES